MPDRHKVSRLVATVSVPLVISGVAHLACAKTANAGTSKVSVFYASPTGGGDGRSPSTPFLISKFWSVAEPGSTLWLLDGHYRGEKCMIVPPPSVRGSPDRPIHIQALREGKVLIDGERSRRPIYLHNNSHVWIEGVNACCSSEDVVYLSGTDGVTLRRVVGWNAAADHNAMIFSIAYAKNTLLEDTAGFGSARKIYQYFKTDGPATIRRAWSEWNWSLNKGPKMTFSLIYSSRNLTAENVIGTWRSLMPGRYTLMDNGKPYVAGVWSEYNRKVTGCEPGERQTDGTCLVTDGKIDQMESILSASSSFNGLTNRRAQSRLLGSLAYVLPGADARLLPRLVQVSEAENVTLADVVAFWPSDAKGKDAILFGNCSGSATRPPCDGSNFGLIGRNITAFGGPARFSLIPPTQWEYSGVVSADSPAALYGSSGASVFAPASKGGASLCYRYQDGVLTKEPLWPWPMNERIKDAMIQAGREPVDVTRTMEELFGPIPSACRAGGNVASRSTALASPAIAFPRQ